MQSFDSLSYGIKTEQVAVKPVKSHPLQLGNVIVGAEGVTIFHTAREEHVQGGNLHARVAVSVWYAEQVSRCSDLQACLLKHFTCNAFLDTLAAVTKPAGQVKCALRRLLGTCRHKDVTLTVGDYSHVGCRRVQVVCEAAVAASFRLEIVLVETGASAFWAMGECS